MQQYKYQEELGVERDGLFVGGLLQNVQNYEYGLSFSGIKKVVDMCNEKP